MSTVEQEKQVNIKEKEDRKKRKIVFIICIIIIMALLGTVLYLLAEKKKAEEVPKRNVVVNKDNVDDVLKGMEEEKTPMGHYEAKMNSVWNFETGDASSKDAYVENVTNNTNSVYFDVIRSDNNETIFESPILPVGSYLEEITLNKKLPAGTYDCILVYHLLNEEEESISTVKVAVTINIEK